MFPLIYLSSLPIVFIEVFLIFTYFFFFTFLFVSLYIFNLDSSYTFHNFPCSSRFYFFFPLFDSHLFYSTVIGAISLLPIALISPASGPFTHQFIPHISLSYIFAFEISLRLIYIYIFPGVCLISPRFPLPLPPGTRGEGCPAGRVPFGPPLPARH